MRRPAHGNGALFGIGFVLALSGLLGAAAAAQPTDSPEALPHPVPLRLARGALVIVGGGRLPESVRDRFVQLAGGKNARLVLIPTASAFADSPRLLRSLAYWKAQGLASVTLLHTWDPAQANDPAFVKPLTEATAVWLTGGKQYRLVKAYHGTLVERELQNLLARGGVIGGTSAGAAAMSPLMILGGRLTANVGPGFGFLPGVVIDQHFANRHRVGRLLDVVAKHPAYLGLGIDEQTAAVVTGHTLTVVGNASVQLCLAGSAGHSASVYLLLRAGDHVDLAALSRTLLSREETPAGVERSAARAQRPATAP